MRGLFGDFSTMPLKDLVGYLGNRRVSGVLGIEHDGERRQVVIREGVVVTASSNEPREFLGRFLVNLGHLTEEQFQKAFQTQKETNVFLGKILLMIGAVSEEVIRNALNLKLRETLLQAFRWSEGTFSFDPDAPTELPDAFEVGVDLLEVHRESEFRETAWQAIRAAFPSGDVRLEVVHANLPEMTRAGSFDDRMLQLVRQDKTIDEIIAALDATDFFLYQRLFALYRLDAVRVRDADETPLVSGTLEDEGSLAEILTHAETCVQEGRFDDAEELARRAYQMALTPETEALLRRAEMGLLGNLRGWLAASGSVSLTVPPAKLKTMPLSAPERYLLSRVDGSKDVSSIIELSPLHELEALKLFKRLVDSGLVRLDAR
ncbi:MAG TPA: DUF4388 domain-containing protein [Myxococcaceae bacterium]|nr:DUF4388 domain-containing protein [Myxococcaceae bacterium]